MGELKRDETTADKNDPAGETFQFHEFNAGNHDLNTIYGQLHGNRTGGQNDESGRQPLIEDSNRTSVGEVRPALYKIDTSFFKTVDCFIRCAFRKSVFRIAQLQPTGKCRRGNPDAGKMVGTGDGLGTFVKPFFSLTAPEGACPSRSLAVLDHCDGQAVAI